MMAQQGCGHYIKIKISSHSLIFIKQDGFEIHTGYKYFS